MAKIVTLAALYAVGLPKVPGGSAATWSKTQKEAFSKGYRAVLESIEAVVLQVLSDKGLSNDGLSHQICSELAVEAVLRDVGQHGPENPAGPSIQVRRGDHISVLSQEFDGSQTTPFFASVPFGTEGTPMVGKIVRVHDSIYNRAWKRTQERNAALGHPKVPSVAVHLKSVEKAKSEKSKKVKVVPVEKKKLKKKGVKVVKNAMK